MFDVTIIEEAAGSTAARQLGRASRTVAVNDGFRADVARPTPEINFAIGDGAVAGAACHQSLVFSDLIQPVLKEAA